MWLGSVSSVLPLSTTIHLCAVLAAPHACLHYAPRQDALSARSTVHLHAVTRRRRGRPGAWAGVTAALEVSGSFAVGVGRRRVESGCSLSFSVVGLAVQAAQALHVGQFNNKPRPSTGSAAITAKTWVHVIITTQSHHEKPDSSRTWFPAPSLPPP